MKKVLIIGASILQLPAIRRAKELGYYVGVIDYNPTAIGIKEADEYFNVSTVDEVGIVQTAKKFNPNGIVTLATDLPMRAIAKACEECNLPGISLDTAIKSTDKGEMIKAFASENVAHPWFFLVSDQSELNDIIQFIEYPCVIKPTDNSGSRGVFFCENPEDVLYGYKYALQESHCGQVIVEEYLVGPEFSLEVFVLDGIPHILQITDKLTTGEPHFVEMGHSQPTSLKKNEQSKLMDLATRAIKAVGITNGPAHVEVILTSDGPKMVELGARMGGDNITSHLVPLSTGIDMVGCCIKLACGESITINAKCNNGAAIRYIQTESGIINNITGLKEAKEIQGIIDVEIIHDVGETISSIDDSTDRVGYVIARAENAKNAIDICNQALECIKVEVTDIE